MFRDLNSEIWQIAQQNNVLSRIDLRTYELLTEIYAHQLKITNAEEKIGSVLLSQDSRKPENRRATLILMRDNYKGWAVDRAPGLIMLYGKAIELLKDY